MVEELRKSLTVLGSLALVGTFKKHFKKPEGSISVKATLLPKSSLRLRSAFMRYKTIMFSASGGLKLTGQNGPNLTLCVQL